MAKPSHRSGRTSTIDELLQIFPNIPPEPTHKDPQLAIDRLTAWCKSAAAGDWDSFSQRLAREGLEIDRVLAIFGQPDTIDHTAAAWKQAVDSVLSIALPKLDSDRLTSTPRSERPFGNLLEPIVDAADIIRDELADIAALARFSLGARQDMRSVLLDGLDRVMTVPIYENFLDWMHRNLPGNALSEGGKTYDGNTIIARFLSDFAANGLADVLHNLPVLERVIGNCILQWTESTAEIITRYHDDFAEICSFLNIDSSGFDVSSVQLQLSDLHNGGRSVAILHLSNGVRLVYKPKSLQIDSVWEQLISWLNSKGAPVILSAARILDKGNYGWCAYVSRERELTQAETGRFFLRAGATLGLLHILAATDMHEENVIAAGEYPVIVDLEMLLQPKILPHLPQGAEALAAGHLARALISDSVIETGFLPMIVRTPETALIGQGGLSHHRLYGPRRLGWENSNTPDMRPIVRSGSRLSHPNLPLVDGNTAELKHYWREFRRGFERYLEFILSNKVDLLASGGPLDWFRSVPIRITLHPTKYYEMILRRLRDHRNMADAVTWSSLADFSARFAEAPDSPDGLWPLNRGEREALLKLNVPYFTQESDGLAVSGESVTAEYMNSVITGLDRSKQRIQQLDTTEIARQLDILDLCSLGFERNPAEAVTALSSSLKSQFEAVAADESGVAQRKQLFREEVDRIVSLLARSAIRDARSVAWLGLTTVGDSNTLTLKPLGHSLYSGTTGIALFLAAAAELTQSSETRDLCIASFAATRWYLSSSSARQFARTHGAGGLMGLGSIIYGLTAVARILKDPKITDDALVAARLLSGDIIAADRGLDLSTGSAGAMLALLSLHDDTQEPWLLDAAVHCANHLLRHRQQCAPYLWTRNREPVPLAGISHGASGYALAFGRLYTATSDERFFHAFENCIRYECAVFSTDAGNWPDLRPTDDRAALRYLCHWCHGATGIGLARLALLREMADDSTLRADVKRASDVVLKTGIQENDSLCCGNLGAVAFLTNAGQVLADSRLQGVADERLERVIQTRRRRISYKWQGGEDEHNLGLFKGIAGAGYILAGRCSALPLPDVLTLK